VNSLLILLVSGVCLLGPFRASARLAMPGSLGLGGFANLIAQVLAAPGPFVLQIVWNAVLFGYFPAPHPTLGKYYPPNTE